MSHHWKLAPGGLRHLLRASHRPPVDVEKSASQSAAQVAATGDYGDIPLVVLSANSASPSQMKEHESLAHLSSQGKHVVASKGGHWVQLDEPDLVIESIREVVESVGRRSSQ